MNIGGYISTKDAAVIMNVTSDYICRLCREGVLGAVKIGHDWLVSEKSAMTYAPGPKGFALYPRKKKQE